jgi:hypothetical protein
MSIQRVEDGLAVSSSSLSSLSHALQIEIIQLSTTSITVELDYAMAKRRDIGVIALWLLTPTRIQSIATSEYDQESPLVRVMMNAFDLRFSPTPSALTLSDEILVHEAAEHVIRGYLAENSRTPFEYALLADIEQNNFDERTPSTVLSFTGGVATFRTSNDAPAPTVEELNAWVQAAVQEELFLQLSETVLSYITKVSYLSLSDPPTPAPSTLSRSFGGVSQSVKINQHGGDNGTGRKAFIAVATLAVVGIFIGIFVMKKRRRETCVDKDAHISVDAAQQANNTSFETIASHSTLPNHDTASLDGSEWTLGTNIASRAVILPTESFERDRQYLKKDMLQADMWTSPIPNGTLLLPTGMVIAKSRSKKLSKRTMSALTIERTKSEDSDWDSDLGNHPVDDIASNVAASKESPFLFESAGEEVYLMPPSQSDRKRVIS